MKNVIKCAATAMFIANAMAGSATAVAQDKPMPRMGFVAGAGGYPRMAVTNQAFFDGLSDAGYKDGSHFQVVFRTAEGNMSLLPQLVREVLAEKPDYLVVSTSPGCAAARKATTSVPVLCISVQDDPIKEGLTSSLSHGSGNLVGVHSHLPDGIAQQLAMLRKLKPDLRKLGVLFNPKNETQGRILVDWERVAASQSIGIFPMPAVVAAELEKVVAGAKAAKVDIAIGLLGADTYAMRKEIAEAATASGLPIAMDTPGGYTQMGGVATIGVDIVPLYRRAALEQMVPMLKGVRPSDLPWIGPTEATMRTNDQAVRSFQLQGASK